MRSVAVERDEAKLVNVDELDDVDPRLDWVPPRARDCSPRRDNAFQGGVAGSFATEPAVTSLVAMICLQTDQQMATLVGSWKGGGSKPSTSERRSTRLSPLIWRGRGVP